jgi:homoserine O-acetyltransferase
MKRSIRSALRAAFGLVLAVAAGLALAQDLIVKKEVFTLPSYTTVSGQTIKHVRVGYQTAGQLNAARDNAILVCHFFSGTSHAFGKYAAEDKAAGYWDAIIGPGKPIDTNKYFVVSSDTLVNLNAKVANVITTGPASINPDTGKPWGMSFPVVSIRDFVNVQKALLDQLGIKKLHAVGGASGGAVQSVEWAAAYPDIVDRFIAVIGPGLEMDAYGVAMLDLWSMPIRLDPKWSKGDYYGKDEPLEGLAEALKFVTFSAVSPGWGEKRFGRKWAKEGEDPAKAYGNLFAVEAALNAAGAARAKTTDANNYLYMSKANQLFSVDPKRIRAKGLFVPVTSDLIFPPVMSRRAADTLRKQGNAVDYFEIPTDGGHIDGVTQIGLAAKPIAEFLAR